MSSHSFRRRLFFLAPAIVCALPQPSTPTLPQSLQPLVPTCSWSCLSSFIQSNFPSSVCTAPQDIDCLCSHAGLDGFNLEEGAFVCAHQNCPDVSGSTINATYNICSGRPNAVEPTHTVLPTTLTAMPTATMPNGASATSPSGMTAPATTAVPSKNQLNTSQIVGISVAGAVVLIAVAVAIFLLCLRRRRQRRLKLDSDPLPYEEFKTPPPRHLNSSGRSSPASAVKDPRGGAGGVGVAPAPIRYKAIHPPSNLFFYPEQPEDVGKSVAPNTNAGNFQQSATATPPPNYAPNKAQPSYEPARSQSPPRPSQTVPHVAVTSPSPSATTLLVPTTGQSQIAELPTQRNPSLLLPAKPELAVLADERPYSVMSQTTQFEEDFQSPTIPPNINNMTIYPVESSSSEQTMSSSDESVSRNKNDRGERRKSRGPSLRISIPGKWPGPAPKLPPPPPRGAKKQTLQRPQLAAAGAAGLPFPPPLPPPLPAQQRALPPVLAYSAASTSSSSIPLQFPLPPSSKPTAAAEPTHTERFRSDSVSRRGFSQPHTTAFQAARQQTGPVSRDYAGPFTVNGERINYPNIPRPSPPANSYTVPSPPAGFPLPPPPPRLPAVTAQFGPASNRSSEDIAFDQGYRVSASNSLLAKRRGSDRAAVLEKQLYINRSNFGTAGQAEYAPSASPTQFRGAGHGRIDSKGVVSPDIGTGTSFGSNPTSASSLWVSRGNNYVPGQPVALQTRQGNTGQSPPYDPSRWASPPNSGNNVAGGVKQQYAPYYPPPPRRPAPKNTEGAKWSPSPTRMTPTRRGADLYLSVS